MQDLIKFRRFKKKERFGVVWKKCTENELAKCSFSERTRVEVGTDKVNGYQKVGKSNLYMHVNQ